MSIVLRVQVQPDEYETVTGLLWEQGTTGVQEEEQPDGSVLLSAYFEEPYAAERCLTALTGRSVQKEEVVPQDWSVNQQRNWRATEVGQRFFLAPPWDSTPAPPSRFRLIMQPGPVFGAGDHPTTRLCLELLEQQRLTHAPVLDVGTGTGILALAASLLGAATIWACDLDPEAIRVAQAAFADAPTRPALWQGSTESCRPGAASLVLANLPGGALIDVIPELRRVLQPGGTLIASGYFTEQLGAVEQALQQEGFHAQEWRTQGDWSAVLATRSR